MIYEYQLMCSKLLFVKALVFHFQYHGLILLVHILFNETGPWCDWCHGNSNCLWRHTSNFSTYFIQDWKQQLCWPMTHTLNCVELDQKEFIVSWRRCGAWSMHIFSFLIFLSKVMDFLDNLQCKEILFSLFSGLQKHGSLNFFTFPYNDILRKDWQFM